MSCAGGILSQRARWVLSRTNFERKFPHGCEEFLRWHVVRLGGAASGAALGDRYSYRVCDLDDDVIHGAEPLSGVGDRDAALLVQPAATHRSFDWREACTTVSPQEDDMGTTPPRWLAEA